MPIPSMRSVNKARFATEAVCGDLVVDAMFCTAVVKFVTVVAAWDFAGLAGAEALADARLLDTGV